MSRKRKNKKTAHKKASNQRVRTKKAVLHSNKNLWPKFIAFLAGSGLLVVFLSVSYQYLSGKVSLEYVQDIGRSYEFRIKNDTPADKLVKSFRLDPPQFQNFVFTITEDLYASVGKDGAVALPGGNMSYIPAAEFKGLDGNRSPANSEFKFRVPPLSSRPWLKPEAMIVDVHLETQSLNPLLINVDRVLEWLGLKSQIQSVRYLVVENYWTVTTSSSIDEAIRVFCRDNDIMAKSVICTER